MSMRVPLTVHGRGANDNPPNRFDPIELEPDPDYVPDPDDPPIAPQTRSFHDTTRTIIAHNDSPDVGFEYSINPYRGCEHGCTYCYARPTHEYLSLGAGLDFETKIFVKLDAPKLLRKELMKPKWQPQRLAISGVTDCYQPAERRFGITRKCLEVLLEFRNPCSVIAKSHLVTRDIDLLSEMAKYQGSMAFLSVTTLDPQLSAAMEPRAASPQRRLDAISQLSRAGIPTGVMVAPLIPGLTDHEMPMILKAAAEAGAVTCGYVPLRLPGAVRPIFEEWLGRTLPDRKNKVMNRIRSMRSGKLNDSNFHTRMRGDGEFAEQFKAMFEIAKRRAGLDRQCPLLSTDSFVRRTSQLSLF